MKFRRMVFACAVVLISLNCNSSEPDATEQASSELNSTDSDSQALQIVDEMWHALGGREAWQDVRYLKFQWFVERDSQILSERRHDWDRQGNRYRLERTTREGQHLVAIFDTQTKEGQVYLDGEIVTEDSTRRQMLDGAYGAFINDTYWLLMPYKLNDPGVILNYEGEKQDSSSIYDVIRVSFDSVGLTAGDVYWAYISQDDRLMHKWEYVLQSYEPDRPPTECWWRDWQTVGGIKLAMDRVFDGRAVRIFFDNVVASSEVDESIFESTEKTL